MGRFLQVVEGLKARKALILVIAALISLSSVVSIQLLKVAPPYDYAIDTRAQAIQFVASDPPPDVADGYVLQRSSSGYAYGYSLFLGTWPKNQSRIFPAAFAIVNSESVYVRIVKISFLGLAADQKDCIYSYLHRDPRKVSNVSTSATMGIPTSARETLYNGAVSSITYVNGSLGSADHTLDGWVLAPGFGYGYPSGPLPTMLNYSIFLGGATRDTATFNTTRNVWVRDQTELITNGHSSSLTTSPGTTASNFVWVDVTVDTTKPSCRQNTFSVGSIEMFVKSE